MHDKQVRRRRAVLAVLVVISLLLLTDYFGESSSSPLHRVQRGIVAVLSPIQSGASTVFSPVSDVANWVSTTLHSKTQRDQLKRQLQAADQQLAKYKTEAIQNRYLSKQLGLAQSVGLNRYHPVGADVEHLGPCAFLGDEGVLDGGADHAGGAFGAEGDRSAAAVVEGVHLLIDDVAGLADAAVKQLGVLEDRGADLVKMI